MQAEQPRVTEQTAATQDKVDVPDDGQISADGAVLASASSTAEDQAIEKRADTGVDRDVAVQEVQVLSEALLTAEEKCEGLETQVTQMSTSNERLEQVTELLEKRRRKYYSGNYHYCTTERVQELAEQEEQVHSLRIMLGS